MAWTPPRGQRCETCLCNGRADFPYGAVDPATYEKLLLPGDACYRDGVPIRRPRLAWCLGWTPSRDTRCGACEHREQLACPRRQGVEPPLMSAFACTRVEEKAT